MSNMSKERAREEEETKKELRLEPTLPQAPLRKEPVLKSEPSSSMKPIEGRLTVLQPLDIGPPIRLIPPHREFKIARKEEKEEEEKFSIPKIIQAFEIVRVKLKPKPLKAQVPEYPKPSAIHVQIEELPKRETKISLRPLKQALPSSESVTAPVINVPVLKPSRLTLKRPLQLAFPSMAEVEDRVRREEVVKRIVQEQEFEPYLPNVFGIPEGLLDEESRGNGLLAKVSPEGFVCIVVDKKRGFDKFIEFLCSILFRIKSKGLPSVWTQGGLAETFFEFKKRGDIEVLEDLSKKLMDALSNIKGPGIGEPTGFLGHLKELRLEKAFRYLVLSVDKKEDVMKVADVLMNPGAEFRYYIPKLYAYTCRELDLEDWYLILQAMFGFVGVEYETFTERGSKSAVPSASKLLLEPHDIGRWCLELDRRFYETLDKIKEEVTRRLSSGRQPRSGKELGQEESALHYSLKFLVVKHLIDNLKVSENSIRTEEEVESIIPDVYVSWPKKIAVEIETFYGTGDPYHVKLISKVEDYRKAEFKDELWLVVPNIQALLFVDELLKLRRDYKKELDLEVYTLDLTGYGAELTCGERRGPGLIRLIDVLRLFKERGLKRPQKFLEI
jgi:hypothetical protein